MEIGIVGRFGFIGVPVVIGTMRSTHRCVMEVAGEALEIKSNDIRRSMQEHAAIRQQLMNYVQALLIQHSQTALCNGLHQLEQRLARWLLLARDRLDSDVIPLTHQVFSIMLGVRRAGITKALGALERAGAVRKQHGSIVIIDRGLLEQNTCECYQIIAAEYRRLIDPDELEKLSQSDRHTIASV
jgi:CRP-like cAMP-binding protein